MIKQKYKIIGVVLFLGLSVAVMDDILEHYFLQAPKLFDFALLKIPRNEIYIQIFNMIIFLFLGIILSQYINKVEQVEKHYHQLFDNLKDSIFVTPMGDNAKLENISDVNPEACQSLGYSKEELLRLSLNDIAEIGKSGEMSALLKRMAVERHVLFETVLLAKDGTGVPVEINAHRFNLFGKPTLLMIVRDTTVRKQTEAILLEKEKQLSVMTAQLLNIQEIERSRMSRELHDELGQAMMLFKFQLSSLCDRLRRDHALMANECGQLLGHVDEIIDNIRRFAKDLNPTLLEDLGLPSTIKFMIEEFVRNLNITAKIDIDEVDNLLAPQVKLNIYRIFQESLTNISKHSHAANISCLLKKQGDHVYVEVWDDGKGFDLKDVLSNYPKSKRFGLATISERVRLIGEALEVRSQEGVGTCISFTVPIEGEKTNASLSNFVG